MRIKFRWALGVLAAAALTAGMSGWSSASAAGSTAIQTAAASSSAYPWSSTTLKPSSAQLAKCMPKAKVQIKVELKTDAVGFDDFEVHATGLPPKTAFTVFLLQRADAPFGAAEYIGDIFSDKYGVANNEFKLIVAESFSSTLVNGKRVRVDLNQIGMWFADEAADDFCLGKGKGPVTPFDGDNKAGTQAFNSLGFKGLPAP